MSSIESFIGYWRFRRSSADLLALTQILSRRDGFKYVELDRDVGGELILHFIYEPRPAQLATAFLRFIKRHHDEFSIAFGDDFIGGQYTGSVVRRRKGH